MGGLSVMITCLLPNVTYWFCSSIRLTETSGSGTGAMSALPPIEFSVPC